MSITVFRNALLVIALIGKVGAREFWRESRVQLSDTDVRSRRYLILVRILAVAYVPLLHRKHAFGIATEHYMYFREGALRFVIRSR
jgi:hypothetical protein